MQVFLAPNALTLHRWAAKPTVRVQVMEWTPPGDSVGIFVPESPV